MEFYDSLCIVVEPEGDCSAGENRVAEAEEEKRSKKKGGQT